MQVEYTDNMKIAYYNGERFTRDERTGYYLSARKVPEAGKRMRLHKYVWLIERGEIPEGCQIHHKDEDKSHNDIDNLACMSEHDHLSYHSSKMSDEVKKKFQTSGMDAARKWHSSEAGHEWHKEHYERMKDALKVEHSFICAFCGKDFKSTNTKSRFCCNACKAAARRASGVDDEKRICIVCGKEFMTSKYLGVKTCSTKCRGALIWKARRIV